MLDILINNGQVVDGSGAPAYKADVALERDRIVHIGRLESAEAETVIDASGCVVTPGFVDMHSHADFTLPVLPSADSLVHQGITTAVVGQCGVSLAPLFDATREQAIAALESKDIPLPWGEWTTFDSYVRYLADNGTSINVVPLVGQGTVRAAVMGFAAGPASDAQTREMQGEVVKAMGSGAIGVSTGLIYPPGSFSQTDELVDVTRPAGQRDGYYFSHMRGEDEKLLTAITEAIRIGRETGAAVQISHFKASGRDNWGLAARGLELIDRARAEGLEVSADMYPYRAGSTGLAALLPLWAAEGGTEATLKRLAELGTRREMVTAMQTGGFFRFVQWEDILISGSPRQRSFEGRFVADLADEAGKSGYDWVFDALLETELDIDMIVFAVSEDNLKMQLRHPAMMIGTDADGRAPVGLLSKGLPHPRNYGTYPRVLARYVREEAILSLEEAVWKMSGFPAQKLRWSDRGLVKTGYKADLVILDPDTVADAATYKAPHQFPVGISHVFVNGKVVVTNGLHNQARPGKILAAA